MKANIIGKSGWLQTWDLGHFYHIINLEVHVILVKV